MLSRKPPLCSVCSTPLDVHQVVRGGVCDSAACRGIAARRAIERQHAEERAAHEAIARAHLPALLAQTSLQESDVAVLTLPVRVAPLTPPPGERREQFRASVRAAVAAAAAMPPAPVALPDDEDAGCQPVFAAACNACRGACCRYGGDTAYIDAAVVCRVRELRPGLSDEDIVAMYMKAIPERTVEGSCILHGESGCALPREHRSQVCNHFFCRPVREWERKSAQTGLRSTAVFVLHEDQVIRSTLVGRR